MKLTLEITQADLPQWATGRIESRRCGSLAHDELNVIVESSLQK